MSKLALPQDNLEALNQDVDTSNKPSDIPNVVPADLGDAIAFYPRLACSVSFDDQQIIFSQAGQELAYQNQPSLEKTLQSLFLLMDGSRSLAELQRSFAVESQSAIAQILQDLDHHGLIDDGAPLRLATERFDPCPLAQQLLAQRLKTNSFWQALQPHRCNPATPSPLSPKLLYGFALELHHYLGQKSAFQAPLLDFQDSALLREAFLQLYRSELGQAEAMGKALEATELDPVAIAQHLPLPETVALINGLAFWAQTEPLFVLSLQGILNHQIAELMTRYYLACSAQGLEPDFIMQVGECVINGRSKSGSQVDMTCATDLLQLDRGGQARFRGQVYLFTELYCNWLEAIATYYSQAPQLQRPLTAFTPDGASPDRPRLKHGVLVRFRPEGLEIRGEGRGVAIALPPGEQPGVQPGEQPGLQQLVRSLQLGGFSRQELLQLGPAQQTQQLIEVLESHQWLATSRPEQPLSGPQFYRELSRFLNQLKQQFPPSPMSQRMAEGSITREQLIGYVLESYHVTHLCPRLLAPSLAQAESPKTQALLREFFTSELHHDQLVENSLQSVGIRKSQIQVMQPLPMTFGVCSALGVFARRHPLSFKAALLLFEEDDKIFHKLFEQRCKDLDLPSGFYRPILLHAHINEDGEHDQITKLLLDEVLLVSPEEQQTVKGNLAVLMMSIVLRTHEILDYYGSPENPAPRCF